MRYFASLIFIYFLSPATWLLLLLLLSFITKRASLSKKLRLAALVVFLLFSNQWLLDMYARYWQPVPAQLPAGSTYSCGILLGGYGSPDAYSNSGYFNTSADRFIQLLKLYKTGKIKTILLTGGNGRPEVPDFNEGKWTMQQLVELGVPQQDILFEDQSANTAENALHTQQLLAGKNLQPPYLLVTSAVHMPRAMLLFRYAGVPVIPFPCNYHDGRGKFTPGDLLPDPNVLFSWNNFVKETVGYLIYRIKGK